MQDIYIIGAGGFGREVQWLIERINAVNETWEIKGYIDDNSTGVINDFPVVDTVDGFIQAHGNDSQRTAVVCAIGNSKVRRKVIEKVQSCSNIDFPNLVDPSVLMSGRIALGEGNINIKYFKDLAIKNDAYGVLEVEQKVDRLKSVPVVKSL